MRLRDWLIFCAALLALAVAFSHPLVLHFKTGIPYSFIPVKGQEILHQHPGDYLQLMYRFWLFEEALAGRIPFFTNAYEFSTPLTPPVFVTQGIPLSFIYMLFMPLGNIAAYNALVLLSFLAAGVSFALLGREITGSRGAAIICGILFACVPFRLGHLFGGHMGGLVFFLPPLTLYFFEKSWNAALSGGRSFWWGICCGFCLLSAALMEFHIVFYTFIFMTIYMAFRFAELAWRSGVPKAARTAIFPILGLLIPTALTIAYLLWIRWTILEASAARAGRAFSAVQAFSPRFKDILRKSKVAEMNIYLGLAPIALAVYGFVSRRREIRRGTADKGALLWIYFWLSIFIVGYILSFGATLEPYLPFYARLHAKVPFMLFSRTPIRVLTIALLGFFILCSYGIKNLLSRGRFARAALCILVAASLYEYHPRAPIGISIMRGMDSVYEEVRDRGAGSRLLDLPIWPGDSAWSVVYGYYATLTGVPIVNGYNPVPQLNYIEKVFRPLRSLNAGEIRRPQYEKLKEWNVRFIVLHQDLFPRKVSPYPYSFTLLNLLNSPYLNFERRDGPHSLFRIRDEYTGPDPEFKLRSPIGSLHSARRLGSDAGIRVKDDNASSGMAICAPPGRTGHLIRGAERFYPAGDYRVVFRIKTGAIAAGKKAATLEVYSPDDGEIISSRDIRAEDFSGTDKYGLFELTFRNDETRRVELRAHHTGASALCMDFACVTFAGEEDPLTSVEAEDLFHIGSRVEDAAASGRYAVMIGRGEDITAPMVSGPHRLYNPGRYMARFHLKIADASDGVVARLKVESSFGEVIAIRDVSGAEAAGYDIHDIPFELEEITPLTFPVQHFNKAILRLDKIDILSAD